MISLFIVAIVPTTATMPPPKINSQSMSLSRIDKVAPNNFKCAAAGKMTDTIMVQISPTKEHRKENDGKKIATAKEVKMSMSFTSESKSSIARSEGTIEVNISSKPNANGNIVNVNFDIAVNIISHVNPVISTVAFSDSFSIEIVI